MNLFLKAIPLAAATTFFAIGCQTQSEPATSDTEATSVQDDAAATRHADDQQDEGDIAAAMAQLSPEDREEAEAQKFCAVMNTNLLGSMGTPLKLDVKGSPVFLCCAGCKSKAMKNADETLATVARLKAENRSSNPSNGSVGQ